MARTLRSLVVVALTCGFAAAASGCAAEADVPPPTYAYGYAPVYYDGYIVYYDGVGRPYYYADGAVIWVSPGSPYYPGLVRHWYVYRPYYHRWYGHYGYRYHGYRYYHRR